MGNKKFVTTGLTKHDWHKNIDGAITSTYTTDAPHPLGQLVQIPFAFPDNPYSEQVLNAKSIFEIGCGLGRNVPWIMENTKANYFAVEPNQSMLQYFYDNKPDRSKIFKPEWKERCYVSTFFDETIRNQSFDVIIDTFVSMHITFRPPENEMNVVDITNEIKKNTHDGTIWILIAHDSEEPGWIEKWLKECNFNPTVFIRKYEKVKEITYRGGHHLVIIKENK